MRLDLTNTFPAMATTAYSKEETIRTVPYEPQSQGGRYPPKTVDELASALLDDSTLDQRPSLGENHIPKMGPVVARSPTKQTAPRSSEARQVPHLDSTDESGDSSYRPPGNRKNIAPAERSSLSMPRKSRNNRGKGSVRTRRVSPRGSSGIGPANVLPRSCTGTIHPLRMNPTKLASSTSVPLSGLEEQLDGKTALSSNTGHASPAEITQKAEHMLAARPSPNPNSRPMPCIPPSKTTSRVSRLMKQRSVFKKMTDALADRFYNKSQIFSKSRGTMGENPAGQMFPAEQPVNLLERDSPVVSIGLRRHEGENRGRDGAQGLDGVRVSRKPTLKNGKSLRNAKSLEDPFSEPACVKRSPTEFENLLRDKSISETDVSFVPRLPTKNPFETENVLGSSIDAILPSAPLASSTPRLRLERSSAASDSPTKKSRGTVASDVIGASLCTDTFDSKTPGPSRDGLGCQVLRETSQNIIGARNRRAKLGYSYVPVVGAEDRKKHPSPNKSDLELLEMRFRKQFPKLTLGVPDENDERDELAGSFTSPFSPNPRVVMENKSRMGDDVMSLDATDDESLSTKARGSLPGRYKDASRLPTSGPLTRSRKQARLTMYRQLPRKSMETDELQWDMKTSSLEMSEVY